MSGDVYAETLEWYERAVAFTRRGPRTRADLRKSAARRAAEDSREWIKGIRRRLGLVAEMHRCRVYEPNPGDDWAWCCQRAACDERGYGCLSQQAALAEALAHARSFVPAPPAVPVSELDLLAYGALQAAMRMEQDAFAIALPGRIAAVAELINERFARELPDGMRFEWATDGG